VPVIARDRYTSKEAVCVVFEKVNTGGKPPGAFELVTAMYAADGHDLRKDWLGDGTKPGRQQRFINTLRLRDPRCRIIGEVSNKPAYQYRYHVPFWKSPCPCSVILSSAGSTSGVGGTYRSEERQMGLFPSRRLRAASPGDENRESAVLLNPWHDDPNDHLTFDDELGIIGSKTTRGQETVRILGLNRDGLIDARRSAIRATKLEFRESQQAFQQDDLARYEEAAKEIGRSHSGDAPFSAVRRAIALREKLRAEQFLSRF
jgi:hypothetical protein